MSKPPPVQWMNAPATKIPNCPPGLEYLTQIDQLLVHQQIEMLEAFTGFETVNKYAVKNSMGQQIYFAAEDTDCCTRMCCGPCRAFQMKIMDNTGNEVMHVHRPLRCDSCWCPCCLQKLEVSAPPGNLIGTVEQEWSVLFPRYRICNVSGDTMLRVRGPLCTWSCCGDVEFQITSADKEHQVGRLTKQWTGLVKETFTDADNFGVTFPLDLDVNVKACLLALTFLIDFMFFEKAQNKETDAPGMLH